MNTSLKRRCVGALLLGCCALTPLAAVELDQLMDMARQRSPQMQAYLINRQNSEIANTLTDTEDSLGIEVTTGDTKVTFTPESSSMVVEWNATDKKYEQKLKTTPNTLTTSANPSVVFTLPNDGKTTIKVGTGASVSLVPSNGARNTYSMTPEISAAHTFTFGETGDARSDLLYSQNTLIASQTYSNNVLSFENLVYQKISSIMTLEQQMRSTQKSIDDLRTTMDNAIKLGTVTTASVSYRNQELQLESSMNSLDNLKLTHQYNLDQYKVLTGLDYEPVTGIREVSLNFTPLSAGNTSVILKQLSLEVAREDLKIERAKQTNTTLGISGKVGVPVSWTNKATTSNKLNTEAKATVSNSNFAISTTATVDVNFSDTGNRVTPALSVAGSWKNNASKTSDTLKLQQLENQVLLAQLDYNDALLSYQSSAMSLQNEVQNWNLSVAQQKNLMEYHKQVLEQQEALFARGLGKQSDVDDAKFTIEQDQYDWDKLLLDGLVFENKIRVIQL